MIGVDYSIPIRIHGLRIVGIKDSGDGADE